MRANACIFRKMSLIIYSAGSIKLLFVDQKKSDAVNIGAARLQKHITKLTRKLNRWITFPGVLCGAPQVAGAGLLAQSGENTFIAWPEVHRVTYD